jgi:uncharacterized protein GlcG (DUF336 family)
MLTRFVPHFVMASILFLSQPLYAQELPTYDVLKKTLQEVVTEKNGGFGLNMWATVVDRDGIVRAVVFSGNERGDQWPGSRVISAQKANTANAFSLPGFALSTANLYWATQPGGSLYGLQHSNPVNTSVAYGGLSKLIGTQRDPMVGKKIGGVNVFGGGLPLYNKEGKLLGAIGVSGDSACADHNIAWKIRHKLALDYVPAGVSPFNDDNIVNDIIKNNSPSGWGHPICNAEAAKIAKEFAKTHPARTKD